MQRSGMGLAPETQVERRKSGPAFNAAPIHRRATLREPERDREQDYFVDGVTESLTTDLSRIAGSFVIAGTAPSHTRAEQSMYGKSAAN